MIKGIVGFHATRNQRDTITITTSDGLVISNPPYLNQLLERYSETQNVIYDLDYFVAVLLFGIGITKEQGQQLLSKGRLYLDGYKIVYFPKSFFLIESGRWNFKVVNANQDGYLKPYYTEDNSVEDALRKAKEARDTAVRVSMAFQYLNLSTDDISSPIKAFLQKNKLNWPTADDCPDETSAMSWNNITGHWFETTKFGLFPKLYSYDRNGSYNACLSELPDIRRGKFVEATTPPDGTLIGIAEGILETSAEFHPFLSKIKGANYTLTGKMPMVLGLEAIKLLRKWNLGTFTIIRGFWWIPTSPIYNIYKGTMNYLWNKKINSINPTERAICTRIYSGLWGLQSQYLHDKNIFGDRFCPFVNYIVEENSRIRLAETCLEYKIIPHAILGDGFITDIELSLKLSSDVGGWKLVKSGRCLISGSGQIAFESNEPPSGLALHFNTLIRQMQEHPKLSSYRRDKYSPITLALSLQQDFGKLGMIHKVSRSLQIGYGFERQFISRPKNGSDLLTGKIHNSSPWDFSILKTKYLVNEV